jgi:hypothetical protein
MTNSIRETANILLIINLYEKRKNIGTLKERKSPYRRVMGIINKSTTDIIVVLSPNPTVKRNP